MENEEARFIKYKEIHKKYPRLDECIRATEERVKPDRAERLYLYSFLPIIFGYVSWVVDKAIEDKRKRLYFLSRDGYQFYLIAKKIVNDRNVSLECRYLNVSRFSVRIPSYHLDIDRAIDLICVGGIDVTLRRILMRGGLDSAQIEECLLDLGKTKVADDILNYQQIQQLKDEIRTSKLLEKYILEHSKEAYEPAIGYFRQEGLLDDISYALVDSGWVGTLQLSLELLLNSVKPGISLYGYYFGMYETPTGVSKDKYKAYYFRPTDGLSRKVDFSNSLFEAVISAPEAMTLGYRESDTKESYTPVLSEQSNPNSADISKNICVLTEFLCNVDDVKLWQGEEKKWSELAEALLGLVMARPTKLEVSILGEYVFSDDMLEKTLHKTAANLSEDDIKNQRLLNKLLIYSGVKKKEIRESAWIEGSIVALGDKADINLRHARYYKNILYLRKQKNQGNKN